MIRLFAVILAMLLLSFAGCSKETTVEESRAAGKKAFLNKNYTEARTHLRKAIAKEPSDKELLYLMARSFRHDYVYDSSLFYLKKVDILYPEDREVALQIYTVANSLEEWRAVADAIMVLAKTGDGCERYYGELSTLWGKMESPYNALYWGSRAIEREPDNPMWYVISANGASLSVSPDSAITILDSAISHFGEDPRFLANKATFLSQKEEFRKAEQILRPLVESDSTVLMYRMGLAHALAKQNRRSKRQEALELYRGLQSLVAPEFKIDSIIVDLEEKLK